MSNSSNIRVKVIFPTTSPIATKTFDFSGSATVGKALQQVKEQTKATSGAEDADKKFGFYIPSQKTFLDDNTPLSYYSNELKKVGETVEYRERSSVDTSASGFQLWHGVAIGTVVLAVAAGAAFYIRSQAK
mmetsp:Transcript_14880/g.20784  ORF Transcript_14880/g.20784 Transcript_14880/m.20784 type:complete len:131 (-) Transcript_14880:1518-1910(-)|eukprot:CAMPEP_0168541498 /NCGR_PEP_ID=MMETSP0413-20121227/851_1 /TAXON_ID=136452 /ORGANISM="Filamoeba nolandi, Strain NC-AS-23-1" /LENGTH=130 /DNA_ID=CAMNT_0008571321 /DNA_START=125 /DNA_END=517 /DNA_ORIENTATION=-